MAKPKPRTPARARSAPTCTMTRAALIDLVEKVQEDNRSLRYRLDKALETSEMRRLHSEMWKAAADLWLHRLAATAAARPGIGLEPNDAETF